MNIGKQIKEGLATRNPVLVRYVGLSAALAVTTSLFNALGMGLAVLAVLTLSNGILSALRQYIPDRLYGIGAVTVMATLAGVADLVIQAFFPELAGDLGLFLPLLAVTCILLSRAGSFAGKNSVGASIVDGICQGAGYTLALVIIGMLRELLGRGSFARGLLNGGRGVQLFPAQFAAGGMVSPVGGFLTLACVGAAVQYCREKAKKFKRKERVKKG